MSAQERVDSAMIEAESLRKLIAKGKTVQVRTVNEQAIIKATALAWYNNHRPPIVEKTGPDALKTIDGLYRELLESCERAVTRARYVQVLKALKPLLVTTRSDIITGVANAPPPPSNDQLPDFGKLVTDQKMRSILESRWSECVACIGCGAILAGIVMMGGLLEAVLLARIHREPNKGPITGAKAAPIDPKTGKVRPLTDWGLQNYIDVAHELKWITVSAMSVSNVLREYRNYVHPYKEYSHGVLLQADDASLLWDVSKTITRQVIKSIP